jgi:alpha-D-ribose 1-methylphosphonate 5-triphosphate synthase subunit PhnH
VRSGAVHSAALVFALPDAQAAPGDPIDLDVQVVPNDPVDPDALLAHLDAVRSPVRLDAQARSDEARWWVDYHVPVRWA